MKDHLRVMNVGVPRYWQRSIMLWMYARQQLQQSRTLVEDGLVLLQAVKFHSEQKPKMMTKGPESNTSKYLETNSINIYPNQKRKPSPTNPLNLRSPAI